MNKIKVLSQETIDRIAAGEVVERPASVVKELVENAIDAGANAVTVEIRDGGSALIRVTDNGCGIPADQVRTACLQHATSKITRVEDLLTSGTLGFRGEALSSIAAVSQMELITKTAGSLTGIRYLLEGGVEKSFEEIGAPEGTTFLIRNLFYNTPARKKFLRSNASEAGSVSDLMERMALAFPSVSFKLILNGSTKLHTSGNSSLRDVIYSVYGRDIASNLVKTEADYGNFRISGYVGKPAVSRGNRNYETYFVNGRYIRSAVVARGIEDAFRAYLMNHRYPFTVLRIELDAGDVDVNVHPQKLEVRFANQQDVCEKVCRAVKEALLGRELIPEFSPDQEKHAGCREKKEAKPEENAGSRAEKTKQSADRAAHQEEEAKQPKTELVRQEQRRIPPTRYPEPFEKIRSRLIAEANSPYGRRYPEQPGVSRMKPVTGSLPSAEASSQGGEANRPESGVGRMEPVTGSLPSAEASSQGGEADRPESGVGRMKPVTGSLSSAESGKPESDTCAEEQPSMKPTAAQRTEKGSGAEQLELFDGRLLDRENRKEHRVIGQIFDTYWIVEFRERMYLIDQHAAHEKVLYERLLREYREKRQTSQMITPPVIVTLNLQESNLLESHMDAFGRIGFEISPFGGREYAISAVPGNLYGIAQQDLFLEILDGLSDVSGEASGQIICEKIASMSCKAAVKGNHRMSEAEAGALIDELLELENPYNCPHGRPVIISMTRYELEKKFRRVL